MRKLTNNELQNIDGGGISFGIGLLIGAAVVFLAGVTDGYVRPLACRS